MDCVDDFESLSLTTLRPASGCWEKTEPRLTNERGVNSHARVAPASPSSVKSTLLYLTAVGLRVRVRAGTDSTL